ncbi:MAG TPA: S9 family peptidase [Pyrinomonadaceae bacterium]|nr:S9 family peptidase [Pyrinomonadaceae bacterium]
MPEHIISSYGSWKSPITSDLIVSGSVGLNQPTIDGDDVYWIEMRPSEGGRSVIVKCDAKGVQTDVTPTDFNARTRVHEYGGGDYIVSDRDVYFSNFTDQNLYAQSNGSAPRRVTNEADMRYADMIVDKSRNRLICVREDHTQKGKEAVNTLVGIDLASGAATVLVSGNDFYSSPRLNAAADRFAWLTWNHPNMPWDGCELWTATVAPDGSLDEQMLVAGGNEESIFHPQWSPDGDLYFVSDRNGWWNLYRLGKAGVEVVIDRQADFGMPQWGFGMSTYGIESAANLICAYVERGIWKLGIVDTRSCDLKSVECPYTDISFVRAAPGRAVMRAGSPTEPASIVSFDLKHGTFSVLKKANNIQVDNGYLAKPETIEFPTEDGLTAHGFFYRPANAIYRAPNEERAPLLVLSHGGPTAAASTTKNLIIQYWTSRGIGVLDVNYGGSTGFGREYRNRLQGKWGIVDVDDCINGARYLVARGDADSDRLMISGGSAGGYTTLCALTFRNLFKAGASYYGVSDAEALDEDTHKFESRYSNGLIGPYPEARQLYYDRSPIHFVDRLSCPVIFFQGLEDKVVPPNQAEKMVAALQEKGIPVAYVPFAGEQHGFRQAQNIKRALDGEFYFYSKVFGFEPAETLEPVEIQNLSAVGTART